MCRHRPRTRTILRDAIRLLRELNRKVDTVSENQDQVNAFVARIDTATAGIRQDIADLKAANPAVDFSALEERVAGLEGLDAENPAAPAEPPAEPTA